MNTKYASVEADKKEDIEKDLKTDATYKFGGLRYYICLATRDWFLLDADMRIVNQGFLISRGKEPTEFPESYKLLPPESKVAGYGKFYFVTGDDMEDSVMQYDVFTSAQNRSRDVAPQNVDIWLYKDLTAYYQNKYPEASGQSDAGILYKAVGLSCPVPRHRNQLQPSREGIAHPFFGEEGDGVALQVGETYHRPCETEPGDCGTFKGDVCQVGATERIILLHTQDTHYRYVIR